MRATKTKSNSNLPQLTNSLPFNTFSRILRSPGNMLKFCLTAWNWGGYMPPEKTESVLFFSCSAEENSGNRTAGGQGQLLLIPTDLAASYSRNFGTSPFLPMKRFDARIIVRGQNDRSVEQEYGRPNAPRLFVIPVKTYSSSSRESYRTLS